MTKRLSASAAEWRREFASHSEFEGHLYPPFWADGQRPGIVFDELHSTVCNVNVDRLFSDERAVSIASSIARALNVCCGALVDG